MTQQPWKWSDEIVQLCWCSNVGLSEYSHLFDGIDGKRLMKEVDVEWMVSRNIRRGSALVAFEEIEKLRILASDSCFIM